MTDRVAGELERHHQASRYQGDEDLVFAHPDTGHPIDASKLRTRFNDALKRASLRKVRFYDLRTPPGLTARPPGCRCGHSRNGWATGI